MWLVPRHDPYAAFPPSISLWRAFWAPSCQNLTPQHVPGARHAFLAHPCYVVCPWKHTQALPRRPPSDSDPFLSIAMPLHHICAPASHPRSDGQTGLAMLVARNWFKRSSKLQINTSLLNAPWKNLSNDVRIVRFGPVSALFRRSKNAFRPYIIFRRSRISIYINIY